MCRGVLWVQDRNLKKIPVGRMPMGGDHGGLKQLLLACLVVGIFYAATVSVPSHTSATAWHPAGTMNAVRLLSMYPDDVSFDLLRQGKDGATCGAAIGTWGVGARERRAFVYDSTGVTFERDLPSYYRDKCE